MINGAASQDFSAVEDLLGARVKGTRALSSTSQVSMLKLSDGQSVVVKTLPRQSADHWVPGQPWTELVTLDSLGYVGAPVPKLLAADVHHGWLIMEYIDGEHVWQWSDPGARFGDLVVALLELERLMAQEWDHLTRFSVENDVNHSSLFAAVKNMMGDKAQAAWDRLIEKAKLGDVSSRSVTKGPLDVNGRNVLWSRSSSSFVFLDMAVIGYDFLERRLVAYAQTVSPKVTSMLNEKSLTAYATEVGAPSVYRLICFDFVFWGIALARLKAAMAHPGDTKLWKAIEGWGDPQKTMDQVIGMWRRPRIRDVDVDTIRLDV